MGTARTESATAPSPRANGASRIRATIATRFTTPSNERDEEGERERGDGADRVERHEGTGRQGPERDRDAGDHAARAQALLDPGIRVGGQGRIDEPRLQRPAVERPVDALEERGRREERHRIGDVQQPERGQADDARQDEDRPAAERVRQAAGRQLEGEDDEALDREDQPDLGQGQPARQREEDGDRDEQSGRQPAQGDEEEIAAPGGANVERGHRGLLGPGNV